MVKTAMAGLALLQANVVTQNLSGPCSKRGQTFSAEIVAEEYRSLLQDRFGRRINAIRLLLESHTCAVVAKVHRQAEHQVELRRNKLTIGHKEGVSTFGQVDPGAMTLIETVERAETVDVAVPVEDAETLMSPTLKICHSQTTSSVYHTAALVAALQRHFPAIVGPTGSPMFCTTTCNARGGYLVRNARPVTRRSSQPLTAYS